MAEEESSSDMEDDTGQDTFSPTPDLWMLVWLQRPQAKPSGWLAELGAVHCRLSGGERTHA